MGLNKYNILNLIAYLVNCFVTFGIGTFGLANRPTNGDISDKYQTIVTPFGTSFSIWELSFSGKRCGSCGNSCRNDVVSSGMDDFVFVRNHVVVFSLYVRDFGNFSCGVDVASSLQKNY